MNELWQDARNEPAGRHAIEQLSKDSGRECWVRGYEHGERIEVVGVDVNKIQ